MQSMISTTQRNSRGSSRSISHLDFPKLTAIGAHFGGWSQWSDGEKYLADNPNVYVDTSSSLYAITPAQAREYINAFTPDRIMFGTDYPMWNVEDELRLMERLDLPCGDM